MLLPFSFRLTLLLDLLLLLFYLLLPARFGFLSGLRFALGLLLFFLQRLLRRGPSLIGTLRTVGNALGADQGCLHNGLLRGRGVAGKAQDAHQHDTQVQPDSQQQWQPIAFASTMSGHHDQPSAGGGSEINPTLATPATCSVPIRVTISP